MEREDEYFYYFLFSNVNLQKKKRWGHLSAV